MRDKKDKQAEKNNSTLMSEEVEVEVIRRFHKSELRSIQKPL